MDSKNNFSSLFNLNNEEAFLEERESIEVSKEKLIKFDLIECEIYENEKKTSLIDSIKEFGILTPLVVRKKGEYYQILDGHNRLDAGIKAGITDFPIRILENISDQEAKGIICTFLLEGQTLQDKRLSMQAEIIHEWYTSTKHQGVRKELIKNLEKTSEEDQKTGFNISIRQIKMFSRVHQHLIKDLKIKMDEHRIPFTVAEKISFLKREDQELINLLMDAYPEVKIDIKKSEALKSFGLKNELTEERIREIVLNENIKKRKKETKKKNEFSFSKEIYESFFRELEKKEIESIIEKAVLLYFSEENNQFDS